MSAEKWCRVYGWLMRLLPREFRQAFGVEMLDVFAARIHAAAARGRSVPAAVIIHELAGLCAQGLQEHLRALKPGPALVAAAAGGQEVLMLKRRAVLLAVAGAVALMPVLGYFFTTQAVQSLKRRGIVADPEAYLRAAVAADVQAGVYGAVVQTDFFEPVPYHWMWVIQEPDIQCVRVDIWTADWPPEDGKWPRYGGPVCFLRVEGGWSLISIEGLIGPEVVSVLARVYNIH